MDDPHVGGQCLLERKFCQVKSPNPASTHRPARALLVKKVIEP